MDFCPEKGEIVSIIGPNGAAKTAFFNTLTGIYPPEDGQIVLSDTAKNLRSNEMVQKAYLSIEQAVTQLTGFALQALRKISAMPSFMPPDQHNNIIGETPPPLIHV